MSHVNSELLQLPKSLRVKNGHLQLLRQRVPKFEFKVVFDLSDCKG